MELTDEPRNDLESFATASSLNLEVTKQQLVVDSPQNRMITPVASQQSSKCTNAQTAFLLIKAYMGVGMLALPYVFSQTGIVEGACTLLTVACTTLYTINLLMQVAKDMSENQGFAQTSILYPTLAKAVYGTSGMYFVRTCSSLAAIVSCISYLVFFNNVITAGQLQDSSTVSFAQISSYIVAFILVAPFSTFQNLSSVTSLSKGALLLCAGACLILFTLDANAIHAQLVQKQELYFPNCNAALFPELLGLSVFLFSIGGLVFPVREVMQEPDSFMRVFVQSTLAVAFFYVFFGALSALALGRAVQEIVLFNFGDVQPLPAAAMQLCFSIAVLFTYPIKFYPVVRILQSTLFPALGARNTNTNYNNNNTPADSEIIKTQTFQLTLARLVALLVLELFSVLRGQFVSALSIAGCLGAMCNQFILPPLIYEKYFGAEVPLYKTFLNCLCVCIGLLGTFLGLYTSMNSLIH